MIWRVVGTVVCFTAIVSAVSSIVTASILVTHHQKELERIEATVAHCLNGGAMQAGERDFICTKLPKWKGKGI